MKTTTLPGFDTVDFKIAEQNRASFLSLGYVSHVRLVSFCVSKYHITWYRCKKNTCYHFESVPTYMVF